MADDDKKTQIPQGTPDTTSKADAGGEDGEGGWFDSLKTVGSLGLDSMKYSFTEYRAPGVATGAGIAVGAVGGAVIGTKYGGAGGAAVGTAAAPGPGTVAGGTIGAAVGAVGGAVVGGVAGGIMANSGDAPENEQKAQRWDAFAGNIDYEASKKDALNALNQTSQKMHPEKVQNHAICGQPICTENAVMQCVWGSCFSKLHIVDPKRPFIGTTFKNRVAIMTDMIPGANIDGFAACWNLLNPMTAAATTAASLIAHTFVWTPSPCIASIAPTPWMPMQMKGLVHEVPVVTQPSMCICWGLGFISFVDCGQGNNAIAPGMSSGNTSADIHNWFKVATFGLGFAGGVTGAIAKAAELQKLALAAKGFDVAAGLATMAEGGVYLYEGSTAEGLTALALGALGSAAAVAGLRAQQLARMKEVATKAAKALPKDALRAPGKVHLDPKLAKILQKEHPEMFGKDGKLIVGVKKPQGNNPPTTLQDALKASGKKGAAKKQIQANNEKIATAKTKLQAIVDAEKLRNTKLTELEKETDRLQTLTERLSSEQGKTEELKKMLETSTQERLKAQAVYDKALEAFQNAADEEAKVAALQDMKAAKKVLDPLIEAETIAAKAVEGNETAIKVLTDSVELQKAAKAQKAQEVIDAQTALDKIKGDRDSLHQTIIDLNKENEQLAKDINEIEQVIKPFKETNEAIHAIQDIANRPSTVEAIDSVTGSNIYATGNALVSEYLNTTAVITDTGMAGDYSNAWENMNNGISSTPDTINTPNDPDIDFARYNFDGNICVAPDDDTNDSSKDNI